MLQIRSVRVLIAEQQAARIRTSVLHAAEPVVIADAEGRVLLTNDAFHRLFNAPTAHLSRLGDLAALFAAPERVRAVIADLREKLQPWRGELTLAGGAGAQLAVRADPVPTAQGDVLGYVLIFTDRSERREAEETRMRLQQSASDATPAGGALDYEALVAAILGNASAAVAEISESTTDASIGTRLREVENAARRAAVLGDQIREYTSRHATTPKPSA